MPRNLGQRISSETSVAAPPAPRSGPRGVVPPPEVDLDATLPIVHRAADPTDSNTLQMRCLRCQGTVERGTAPVRVDRDGYKLAWDQVPAWVCKRCDLAYFEAEEVETVRRALSAMRALARA